MFFKLHTRRGFFKDKKEKGGSSKKSGIFRLMKGEKTAATTELFPTIEAGITFSMSEDYEESLVQSEIENDITVKEDERTITFSEAEVMQNELNHIRSLRAKQEEINKMRAVLEELKATYARKIAEKEKQLVKTVEIFEKLLNEREEEVTEVRTALEETKVELTKVCSTLMGCQHDLHEERTKNSQSWFW